MPLSTLCPLTIRSMPAFIFLFQIYFLHSSRPRAPQRNGAVEVASISPPLFVKTKKLGFLFYFTFVWRCVAVCRASVTVCSIDLVLKYKTYRFSHCLAGSEDNIIFLTFVESMDQKKSTMNGEET